MTEYKVIRSNRKTIAIQVTLDGDVIVRAPRRASKAQIESFVRQSSDWIAKQQVKVRRQRLEMEKVVKFTDEELAQLTRSAKSYIPERVAYYARIMELTYNNVTIRHQKTRWGSCSSKGNLNFNCLLMMTNREVTDYVIVHELCHLKHMDHSAAFWREVEKVLPDYKVRRAYLRKEGSKLIERLP